MTILTVDSGGAVCFSAYALQPGTASGLMETAVGRELTSHSGRPGLRYGEICEIQPAWTALMLQRMNLSFSGHTHLIQYLSYDRGAQLLATFNDAHWLESRTDVEIYDGDMLASGLYQIEQRIVRPQQANKAVVMYQLLETGDAGSLDGVVQRLVEQTTFLARQAGFGNGTLQRVDRSLTPPQWISGTPRYAVVNRVQFETILSAQSAATALTKQFPAAAAPGARQQLAFYRIVKQIGDLAPVGS